MKMPRLGRKITIEHLEQAEKEGVTVKLYCRVCGGSYSTTAADYSFWIWPDYTFKCCKVNLLLLEGNQS